MAGIEVVLEKSPEGLTFDYDALAPDIADQMRDRASRIRAIQRASVVEVGRELIAAKELGVDHGCFIQWVRTACLMNIRTAERAMQATKLVEKNDKLSYLPTDGLVALASGAAPKSIVDDILDEIEAGQRPSAAHIKCRIAEAKATAKRARDQNPHRAMPQDLGSDPNERQAATADLIDMLLAWDRIGEFIAASKKADLSKVVEALERHYNGCGDVVEARLEAAPTPRCRPGEWSPREIIDAAVANGEPVTAAEAEFEEPSDDALAAEAATPSSSPDTSDNPDSRIEQGEARSLQGSSKYGSGAAVESDVTTEPESRRLVEPLTQRESVSVAVPMAAGATIQPLAVGRTAGQWTHSAPLGRLDAGAGTATNNSSGAAAAVMLPIPTETSSEVKAEELLAMLHPCKRNTQYRGRQWVADGCPSAIDTNEHFIITEKLVPFRGAAMEASEVERQRFLEMMPQPH